MGVLTHDNDQSFAPKPYSIHVETLRIGTLLPHGFAFARLLGLWNLSENMRSVPRLFRILWGDLAGIGCAE